VEESKPGKHGCKIYSLGGIKILSLAPTFKSTYFLNRFLPGIVI
jgi:hypothetical protein